MSQLLASGAGEQDILDYLAEYVPASIHLCDSDKNIILLPNQKNSALKWP